MSKKKIIGGIALLCILILCIFAFKGSNTHSKPARKPTVSNTSSFKRLVTKPENPHLQKLLSEYQISVSEIMERSHIPGAAVVIVRDTSIIYMKGFGVKAVGTSDSVNAQTVFRLGSVSKCFAPALTGILIQDNVLTWDDKVVKYLPDFALKSKEQTNQLLIRNVLSHTVGLPYHTYTNLVEENEALPSMLSKLREINMIGNVGQIYSYQNVAYSIIAEVVKSATGKTYEQLMTDRIFIPLHMNTASISYKDIMKNTNVAKPHAHHKNGLTATKISNTYYNVAPAGGVNASVADMGEWVSAMLGNRKDVISDKTLDDIFAPEIKARSKNRNFGKWGKPTASFYAMGWRVLYFKFDTLAYHGGYVNGYRSEIALNRNDKIGICILTNATGELADNAAPLFFNLYLMHRDSIQAWDRNRYQATHP